MKKWKIAVIGLAHVHAQILYRDFNRYPDEVEWLGCADIPPFHPEGPEKRMSLSMNVPNPPRLYADYQELLALGPDIAIVCSDVRSHGEVVCELLSQGIHVVVEKPMAYSLEDGLAMCRAASLSGAALAVNWPVAWFGSFRKARELTAAGAVGRPLRCHYRSPATTGPFSYGQQEELPQHWWYQHSRGGGSIMDYAGYGCLLATWFLGGMAKQVSGIRKNFLVPFSDVEDYSAFLLDFGDSVGFLEGSWSTLNSGEIPSGPVIYGTEGTIAADRHSSVVRVYRGASHSFTQPDEVYDTVSEDNIGRNFLDHLEKGTPLFELIEPAFNLKVQAALDAGIRSCESGRAEPVQNPFEEDFT